MNNQSVALGNQKLMEQLGIASDARLSEVADKLRDEGQTVMMMAVNGHIGGLLGVADPIKESAREAIEQLRAEGLHIVMLTGDNQKTAQAVSRQLGLDEVFAEVLPDQKAEVIRQLQAQGRIVAMAGDGINDAPALAQSQVGIAMGTGTDVAIESAGMTLIKGDLRIFLSKPDTAEILLRSLADLLHRHHSELHKSYLFAEPSNIAQ